MSDTNPAGMPKEPYAIAETSVQQERTAEGVARQVLRLNRLSEQRNLTWLTAALEGFSNAAREQARREERASVITDAEQWVKGITYGPEVEEHTIRDIKGLFDAMLTALGRPPASAPSGEPILDMTNGDILGYRPPGETPPRGWEQPWSLPASASERLRCSVCDNLVDPEGHRWGCPGATEGEKENA